MTDANRSEENSTAESQQIGRGDTAKATNIGNRGQVRDLGQTEGRGQAISRGGRGQATGRGGRVQEAGRGHGDRQLRSTAKPTQSETKITKSPRKVNFIPKAPLPQSKKN